MRLLVCAATEFEIALFRRFINDRKFNNVTILITGVGILNTSFTLMKTIYETRPDFIIQAGIAGCFNEELLSNGIFLIENETIGDLGVQEKDSFQSVFDMKLIERNEFPWVNGKLKNNLSIFENKNFKIADAVTVNEITTNPLRFNYYRDVLHVDIESMEGAALHYICLNENIPFLQVRAISNLVGDRDKSKWKTLEAIENLNKQIEVILNNYFDI